MGGRRAQTVFSCSVERDGDAVVFDVMGEINRASAGQFRNQLLTIAKEHPSSITIRMDDASIMDSACVAVLVETWRFAEDHAIELSFESRAASIRQVFQVADSGRVLTLRR